ncbi:trehalose-phosphatase [Streptomyces bathyalis]|uniref:Trehalose-phosphate phosphatase n=1 Tax=Streptomyces bathyalis TaxID=2710756 RepID=A0A7T1T855_9ACTN|nr:trehalose-phosphatase [Streptomyces bathyalis]QPP08161.1 trehalose-phosphatase [Streptomyces bathyalis]
MADVPTPRTEAGREALAAIVSEPRRAVVALDFDGTLAPIVADPADARADPGAVPVLSRLAPRLCAVAVVTGRPAEAAVRQSGLGGAEGPPGSAGWGSPQRSEGEHFLGNLTVLGAYGAERWDAATGRLSTAPPPPGVEAVRAELPAILDDLGVPPGTWTEDKGRAVAVHTRRTDDPAAAFELLRAPLHELADRHGLVVEPGRMVLELRAPGVDKGAALTEYLREVGAGSVLYAGDDLGDLAAFAAVEKLRGEGVPGLLVCSGGGDTGESVPEIADRADVVVDGPAGVVRLLRGLADSLEEPGR